MTSNSNLPMRLGSKIKCNLSFLDVLEKRALGLKTYQIGYDDLVTLKLYSNFYEHEINKMEYDAHYGGIFNLEFSLDGKLLVAACEGKQVLLFDTANQNLINSVDNAHQNCVNCVRFLNDKHFATCSDDTSIKIWDIRKIKSSIRTLHGHSNWVKNIEWSEKDDVMVTSAFDGSIYAWNLRSPTENNMKRNRIEFVDDFPNEAEVISSLQIHPHGWCAVSRNISGEEIEEWTSVHDIQNRDPSDYENAFTYIEEEDLEEIGPEDPNNQRPTDLWMGYISLDEYSNHNRDPSQGSQNMWENFQLPAMGILNSGLIGVNSSYSAYFQQHPEHRNKVIRNLPRMTHFIKEKNVGKGYIKELCFSSDGRIICSPYDKGIRLLAFNERCQELSMCVPENPQQLKSIVEMNNYHKDIVVSCKFSPTHYQLVSGCLGSEIKWYQPVV
ncbi:hypothetical protein NQ314_013682 [Rhamnusium bicolor]|uniref:Uncharacterized protein n=1 Tax=Rhamnusium bicolor TaxID=1586634 RepID=A0AAV8X4N4_9CUCU|nr:hypothetical protein NQ314_013682 [Rhamnusium bicolor]